MADPAANPASFGGRADNRGVRHASEQSHRIEVRIEPQRFHRSRASRRSTGSADGSRARRPRLRRDGPLLTRGRMRGARRALSVGRAVPQPGDHGAARLRPRRIQVFRLSAARLDRRAAHRALSAARRNRQPLERGDGHRGALSGEHAATISTAATRPASRGRRRCCCNTAPATTTACIRISTASTCFRCRRRSCCRSRAPISTAASSC